MSVLEDRHQIILDLRAQGNTTCIALESEVFEALIQYRNDVLNKIFEIKEEEKRNAPETL